MGNNHGTWYDYQVLGLLLYIGNTAEARDLANEFKTKRIESQIEPDGSQPSELHRANSASYSTMNLRAMTLVAQMARQVGIDLWAYESDDGRGIRKAYNFLLPYVLGEETWPWRQRGGPKRTLTERTKSLFSVASTIFREDLIAQSEHAGDGLSCLRKLKYPPRERLFIEEHIPLPGSD